MATFQYTGDGTVEIAGLGLLSPGDTVDAPDTFNLSSRADFKAGSGSGDVREIPAPVPEPDQDPADQPPTTASSTTTSSSTTSTGA